MPRQTNAPSIPCTIGDEASRRRARNALIDWRRAMPDEVRRRADARIAVRLASALRELQEVGLLAAPAHAATADALVCGAFWPVRGEPNVLDALVRSGATIALPRLLASGSLEFGRWSPAATMTADRFGIPVPEPFEPLEPDLLVVPCVGFDARGYRLGYGGGHYDRTLAQRHRPAIGVAYDACEMERFEAAAHDRPLARIVTESRSLPRS